MHTVARWGTVPCNIDVYTNTVYPVEFEPNYSVSNRCFRGGRIQKGRNVRFRRFPYVYTMAYGV